MTRSSFYRSDIWANFRACLMNERTDKDGVLYCARCGKPILKKYDCIGHHKIELDDDNCNDYSISLNPDLVELIHFKCHNIEHGRFEGFTQRVYLVYGSPCAGKSSYVKSIANDDDLILDIDSIWESICKADRYHKPNRLKSNVFGIRDCIIEQIKTRTGKWRNAFIIGGYPLRTDRDRLCNLLDAQTIFIDTDKETCLSRTTNEDWKKYIEDWFESFIP